MLVSPATSNVYAGAVVPIPIRPLVVSASKTDVLEAFWIWKAVVLLVLVLKILAPLSLKVNKFVPPKLSLPPAKATVA